MKLFSVGSSPIIHVLYTIQEDKGKITVAFSVGPGKDERNFYRLNAKDGEQELTEDILRKALENLLRLAPQKYKELYRTIAANDEGQKNLMEEVYHEVLNELAELSCQQ